MTLAKVLAFLLKHWLPIALGLALLAFYGIARHQGAQHAQDKAEKARQAQVIAGLQSALKAAQASAEAAQAARERNDEVIPKGRAESAARVERAGTADAATRLRDVEGALDGLRAAAGAVRGKGAG